MHSQLKLKEKRGGKDEKQKSILKKMDGLNGHCFGGDAAE
jgi:hypothetical protein